MQMYVIIEWRKIEINGSYNTLIIYYDVFAY